MEYAHLETVARGLRDAGIDPAARVRQMMMLGLDRHQAEAITAEKLELNKDDAGEH